MKKLFFYSFAVLFLTYWNANAEITVKEFLAHPPRIHDMSVEFQVHHDGTYSSHRYEYLRYQNGAFTLLQSMSQTNVLDGIVSTVGGLPSGAGTINDYHWYYIGNQSFIAAFEWEGALEQAPQELQRRIKTSIPMLNELLTFGCHLAAPGGFAWEGNSAHLSFPSCDVDATITTNAMGLPESMIYVMHNKEANTNDVIWKFAYEYGNTRVPHTLPSSVTRSIKKNGEFKIIDRLNITSLTIDQNEMTRSDFEPYQFVATNAPMLPAKFQDGKRYILLNGEWSFVGNGRPPEKGHGRILYIGFAVLALVGTVILLQSCRRKTDNK